MAPNMAYLASNDLGGLKQLFFKHCQDSKRLQKVTRGKPNLEALPIISKVELGARTSESQSSLNNARGNYQS